MTDADPDVPELLRIVYLLTRMAQEIHTAEMDSTLARAWVLAMVPVVLAAGLELDQLRGPDLPIARALSLWLAADDQGAAQRVSSWWQQTESADTSLPVAIQDLARQLDAPPS